MINNGKMLKRKRYLCAFVCVAMLSTIFACWASVAGQEEVPGNSDTNTEVIEVTPTEETVEAEEIAEPEETVEDATEETEAAGEAVQEAPAEESGDIDIADILGSVVPVDHKLAVSAASYDAATGILSVDLENTSDKDMEAVILLTDANYATDSIPCGYAQTIIGAGETFTLSVEYAHDSEEAPVIGVKAQYAEAVTSVSKEQYTNGTVGPFLGSGFVSYESMKELDVADVLSMEASDKAEAVTVDAPAAVDETPVKVSAATTYDSKAKELTIKLSLINTALADRVVDADVTVGDKSYELSDIAVRAGNAYEMEYVLENVEKDAKLPVVKVSGTYSDAVTSAKLGADGEIIAPTVYTIADADKNRIDTDIVTAGEAVENFIMQTGFVRLFTTDWKCLIMIGIACVLLFLAIVKGFEPLLLLPIAFGMLLTNLPGAEMFHEALWAGGHAHWNLFDASNGITPGLLDYLYLGVKLGIYPCLIFIGVGAMTDFEPLIANPKSLLLGAAAQLGIFVTFVAAKFLGFNDLEASSIGIIGGADGPTAIFVTTKLAPHLLGPIAVAAYSYMALVPVIQPPIMKALTTKKERCIKMQALRKVSKAEKIIFPIVVTIFVALLVPSAAPLVGALMLGNLLKESGVTERLSKTVQNELMNIVTIFLGTTVGATATADTFLSVDTLKIIAMGVVAFGLGTAGGVLLAKFMNLFLKNKINPLIGSAGVSAVPMAARVSQVVGQKEDPSNFLLMHAMGPNVAGVIGSAIAAGVLIALFG